MHPYVFLKLLSSTYRIAFLIRALILAMIWVVLVSSTEQTNGQITTEQLSSKTASQWAQLANEQGDATRGVNVFYLNSLACASCHLSRDAQERPIGPNLGHIAEIAASEKLSDDQLVESILEPSKSIRKGYESISLRLKDGELTTGLLVDKDATGLRLRNANRETIVIPWIK